MTYLSDLMPLNVLRERIREGYVRLRKHPQDEELMILNYTEKAQYERVWDEVTKQCRGLIIQADPNPYLGVFDGAIVVARPWPKFFNYEELAQGDGLGSDPFEAPATIQDKMDGSLGILYCAPDGDWAIATRGSFESEQAIHATALYRQHYEDYWAPRPGYTYLFEIVYPENRIVLDYGTMDALVLLDVINTDTGRSVMAGVGLQDQCLHGWPGPVTERVSLNATLRDALTIQPRPNAEGLVVTLHSTGAKVKIKQEDYVRLHKLVTGLNERAVWEHLSTGAPLEALLADVPDEFHGWVREVGGALLDRYEILQGRAHAAHLGCLDLLDQVVGSWDTGPKPVEEWKRLERAEFAQIAKRQGDLTPFMFALYDGRDISAAVWKTLRPKGETKSLLDRTEDNS